MTYSIDAKTWRSPNYSTRAGAISSIVCHSCEGKLPSPRVTSLPWLCDPVSKVSAHYYVCRDTEIYQLVDDANEAWHAGVAQKQYQNAVSLGIECEHRSGQDWPAAQKDALAWLLRRLMAQHTIPVVFIETHGQIAIKGPYSRKHDPTDWPHAEFIAWRNALTAARPYHVLGLPVYQRADHTGALWGHLRDGELVVIDDATNGHLADGRGFVDLAGLEAL